jgi:hypothetical protein
MDKIQLLVEQRRAEAVRGEVPKKVMAVATVLGHPIREQGAAWDEDADMGRTTRAWTMPWHDFAWNPQENQSGLPTLDMEEEHARTIGWNYDGLTSGNRLECRFYKETAELTAWWFGRLVFKEVAGQIQAYVPGEWLPKLEKLAAAAAQRKEARRPAEVAAKTQEAERKAFSVIEWLKTMWGYSGEAPAKPRPPQPR